MTIAAAAAIGLAATTDSASPRQAIVRFLTATL